MATKYFLTGRAFAWIRQQAGYTRPDLARLIATKHDWGRRTTSAVGVRKLEEKGSLAVSDRYIGCLVELLGVAVFEYWYKRWNERHAGPHGGDDE